jgi:hypothetical protein
MVTEIIMDFQPFNKIPRLNRRCTVTEKIDGTNASVCIVPLSEGPAYGPEQIVIDDHVIFAGSRTRWITPTNDNHGFAKWVRDNADELLRLGPGHHFGEWWGFAINRGYGMNRKVFSLFNTARWGDASLRPSCCDVVPVLYEGAYNTDKIKWVMNLLAIEGSHAAPGFPDPEGIVVFHHAANSLMKATIKGDEEGKHAEAHIKKERPPRAERNPNRGGRRIADLPYEGPDRRTPKA